MFPDEIARDCREVLKLRVLLASVIAMGIAGAVCLVLGLAILWNISIQPQHSLEYSPTTPSTKSFLGRLHQH